jgi:hypothetical protein
MVHVFLPYHWATPMPAVVKVGFVGLVPCEAEHKLEAAKVVEQNSHHLISEQLAVNETLLQEAARLKLELKALNEVETSAQCVICRDAKPSRAFVPCGHVCVCSSCWDEFDRNSGRCPKCRRDIQFSFSVFI